MKELVELILLFTTVVFCLKDVSYGFVVFLSIRILVPETVRLPGDIISLNTAVICVLFVFSIIKTMHKREVIRANKNFVLAVCICVIYVAIALRFSDFGSLSAQYGLLFQFMITDLIPPFLLLIIIKSEVKRNRIIKAFLYISIICCIYGLISVLIGKNIYIQFIGNEFGADVYLRERLTWLGIETSSTFVSTNSFGYFIVLSIPFCVYLYSKGIYSKEAKLAIILLIINSVLCKKRTAFIVVSIYLTMWFVSGNPKKRLKILLYSSISMLLFGIAIFTVPSLSSLKSYMVTSFFFWNDNIYTEFASESTGSTWELRVRQFVYPFTEIEDNIIFGHGYGWCQWYLSTYALHPILFGFETVIAQIVCNYGILGCVFYPIVMFISNKFANVHRDNKYITMFMISTILLMIGTGAVYWYLFLMIVVLIHNCENYKNSICKV